MDSTSSPSASVSQHDNVRSMANTGKTTMDATRDHAQLLYMIREECNQLRSGVKVDDGLFLAIDRMARSVRHFYVLWTLHATSSQADVEESRLPAEMLQEHHETLLNTKQRLQSIRNSQRADRRLPMTAHKEIETITDAFDALQTKFTQAYPKVEAAGVEVKHNITTTPESSVSGATTHKPSPLKNNTINSSIQSKQVQDTVVMLVERRRQTERPFAVSDEDLIVGMAAVMCEDRWIKSLYEKMVAEKSFSEFLADSNYLLGNFFEFFRATPSSAQQSAVVDSLDNLERSLRLSIEICSMVRGLQHLVLNQRIEWEARQVLVSVVETRAFDRFKARLFTSLYPRQPFAAALGFRDGYITRLIIAHEFDLCTRGEFSWLRDLRETGFRLDDIADILVESQKNDPWIRYQLPDTPVPKLLLKYHLEGCAHSMTQGALSPVTPLLKPKISEFRLEEREMQQIVQTRCGLGGVRGRVHLLRGCAEIRYDSSSRVGIHGFDQTIAALKHFLEAASLTQAAGQCCDSFTVLIRKTVLPGEAQRPVVQMHRYEFSLASSLLQSLKSLQKELDSHRPSSHRSLRTLVGMRRKRLSELLYHGEGTYRTHSGCCSEIAVGIISAVDSTRSMPALDNIEQVVHVCALATQILCLGFLSYSQAHVAPIHPFFMDQALSEIRLQGSARRAFETIDVQSMELSCLGDMMGGPAIVFSSSRTALTRSHGVKHDVMASAEDLLDTFGPGRLVYHVSDQARPCALAINSGIIAANGGDGFHWSSGHTLPESLKSFDTTEQLRIGALWTENPACQFDPISYRTVAPLEPLGTSVNSWQLRELQVGLQAGYYIVGTATSTYIKIPGTTIKDRLLRKSDSMLLLDLEDTWGLRVSLCSAVACRVPLRTVLADLFPIFAPALCNDTFIWQRLEQECGLLENLRLPHFIDFYRKLEPELQSYVMRTIHEILGVLKDTGVSACRNQFRIAWPLGDDIQRGIPVHCEKDNCWSRMLADTAESATFAYVSPVCLESGQCRCNAATPIWPRSVKLLITAVGLHRGDISVGAELTSTWTLQHNEKYLIGSQDTVLKVEVVKPPASDYALLRPTVLNIPPKWRRIVLRLIRERAGKIARLREKQRPEDEAEPVRVAS